MSFSTAISFDFFILLVLVTRRKATMEPVARPTKRAKTPTMVSVSGGPPSFALVLFAPASSGSDGITQQISVNR